MPSDLSAQERDAAGALEIRGSVSGLLDEPLLLRVRGAGPHAALIWRARYRDDDGRVWRSAGTSCGELASRWSPAKEGTGAIAALRSLRPVSIDVRVETADGRAAARTLTRRLAADGVRTRRWRDGLAATLHVPARPAPCATVIVDAPESDEQATTAALAASLLASRGVLVLVLAPARGPAGGDLPAIARERLRAVPGACEPFVALAALDPFAEDPPAPGRVVMPPGVGLREPRAGAAAGRAAAWDALLARLGATPREGEVAP